MIRGLSLAANDPRRHARARRGHPRLNASARTKAWMAGTSPAMTESIMTESIMLRQLLSPARCRASGLLQLHGAAGAPVLDRHHGQISALVAGLRRRIDDLANGSHRIDDLRAGGIRGEAGERLNLSGPV